MLHQRTLQTRLLIVCGLLCGLVLMLSWMIPAQMTVQALPPRPTPVSTATPTAVPSFYTREGGLIELRVQPAQASVWTLIQWQDVFGSWHNIDGWQGTLAGESQIWWVAPSDLGKGPFRWQVYQSRGGKLLAESKAFSLPSVNRETVRIELSLKP
jgi:hypothetical protein